VDGSARRRAGFLKALEIVIEVLQRVLFYLVTGFAKLLPIWHFADDLVAFIPDDAGGMANIMPKLRIAD
jgi:hypothetical protein